MAGQRITRKQVDRIEALGDEGEEQILAWIAEGRTLREIRTTLGLPSSTPLYRWRDKSEARKEAWRQAMVYSATTLSSEALEIADDVAEDPDAIRKAELQVKVRQWLAGVRDSDQFGKDKQAKITINLSNMHLTAVEGVNREIQARAIQSLRAAAEGADYETIPEDLPVPEEDDEPVDPELYALL